MSGHCTRHHMSTLCVVMLVQLIVPLYVVLPLVALASSLSFLGVATFAQWIAVGVRLIHTEVG